MNFSEIISVFAALLSPFSVYIYHLFHRALPLHFPHFPHQTTCKLLLPFIAPLSSLLTVVYFYFLGYSYPAYVFLCEDLEIKVSDEKNLKY